MHTSIWRFAGDPDELVRRYDAMVAEIPRANMRLHLCLRAADGIVARGQCPSREVFEAFASGERSAGCASATVCPSPSGSRTFRFTRPSWTARRGSLEALR